MEKISEIDWARLAAYVDGEGAITIGKWTSKSKRGRKEGYIIYQLRVQLTNTDKRLLFWAKNLFNGSLIPQKEQRPNHKPVFQWRVKSSDAFKITVSIRNFLILKGEQADVAIGFWTNCGRWTRSMHGGRPQWMLQKQESYFQEMKKLNQRGVESE